MNVTVADFSSDRTIFNITGTNQAELDNKLNLFFTSEGYKFKGQKNAGKIYTKGNQFLRVILGAFWKFFKIYVEVRSQNDVYSVLIQKDASGLMGGAVGMAQVKKEFARLTEAFKVYFSH